MTRVGAVDLAFLLAVARGARPRGGGALPLVLSFKDVHQPCGGGKQAELRLHLFGFDGFGAASNGDHRPGC
jgi:hypothetical protein